MKYFLILLVAAIISTISAVTGKIPDYIQVCKRNDPELIKCVHMSINNLRPKLVEGIPELEVPKIDPLHLTTTAFTLGPGFTVEVQDLVLRGGKNFEIHNLVIDVKGNTCSFTIFIPEITATGNYKMDTTLASLPLKGTGLVHVTAKSITGEGTLHGKNVVRSGKTFNWFPSMNLKLKIGDYNIKLENLFEQNPTVGQAMNKLLTEKKTEVLTSLLPEFERTATEYTLLAANNIAKHFTWDELFPES